MARGQGLLSKVQETAFTTLSSHLKIKNGVKTTKLERDQILEDMRTIYITIYGKIKQP